MWRACGPHTIRTASLNTKIRAKVASTWLRWSRVYSRRSTDTSSSTPTAAVSSTPAATPAQKEPVAEATVAAKYAPSMYREPWARFTTSMIPRTRVRPADSRNSMSPNWTPLRSCSTTKTAGT
jgi:hypothetical protein